jgi:arylsulfatase A-like enzyme
MPARPDLPNVIFIVFDTARADAFETYGAPSGQTPTFAQLANSGVAHRRAIASCNWTMPSHVSMLTGMLPRTAGLSLLPGGDDNNCKVVLESHRERFLPEVLRKAGYQTSGASANPWVSERLGFATGYGEWLDLENKRSLRMNSEKLVGRLMWHAQCFLARVDDGASMVDDCVNRWISTKRPPFFWFVNLVECHSPYLPPRPYNKLGPIERFRAGEDARKYQTLAAIWRACATGVMPPQESLERMRLLYERSVTQMDDWLARLCERLNAAGLLDDTLLVVTSDHGENFGEGNLFGHAVSLDDRLLWVPLLFRGPGAAEQGDGITSLTQLPRLIAEAAGLREHPWMDEEQRGGVAVAQYDVGGDPNDPRMKTFDEWGADEYGRRRFTEPCTCATDGRYKLTTLGTEQRFYDLQADPLETNPRLPADAPAEVLEKLRRVLRDAASEEWTPDLEALGASPNGSEETNKDLEERMKLLGYL